MKICTKTKYTLLQVNQISFKEFNRVFMYINIVIMFLILIFNGVIFCFISQEKKTRLLSNCLRSNVCLLLTNFRVTHKKSGC